MSAKTLRPFSILSALCLLLIGSGCSSAQPVVEMTAEVLPSNTQPTQSSKKALSNVLNSSRGDDLKFSRFSVEQGLSKSVVGDIIQDRRGFMWFATEDGLNRFDGVNFKIFKHEPGNPQSLSSNNITSLIQDREGILWVGTKGGGISLFDPKDESFTVLKSNLDIPGSLSTNFISTIYEDWQGIIWVGTIGGGLNRFNRSTGDFSYFAREPDDSNSLSSNYVDAILLDQNSDLWIGTDRGLDRLNLQTGRFRHFGKSSGNPMGLSGEKVSALVETADKNIWIGTSDGGLDRYDPASQRFSQYLPNPNEKGLPGSSSVTSLLTSQSGLIWVGTQSQGLSLLQPETGTYRNFRTNAFDRSSIGSDQVLTVYEDPTGIVWIGTFGGGVSMLDWRSNQFTHFQYRPNQPNSLGGAIVWAVLEDRDGLLWVGTHTGGLNRLNRQTGEIATYRHDPDSKYSLSSNSIRALHQDKQGFLWIGTDKGLDRMHSDDLDIKNFVHDPGSDGSLGGDQVVAIGEDGNNQIWVALANGMIDRFDPQTQSFSHFRLSREGDPDLSVLAMLVEPDGLIWVGTMTGLVRLDTASGQLISYRSDPKEPASLSNAQVMSIYRDQSGRLWIGTMGGLNFFDPQTGVQRIYRKKNGLPNDYIYAIQEDNQRMLWLSTNHGLSRFDPSMQSFENYDILDGLQSNEFSIGAGFQSTTGELFFGGNNGLSAFFPERLAENSFSPPVLITSITQGGIPINFPIDSPSTILLKWPQNYFEFEISALNFSQTSRNQYAYFLEGFDQNWVELGNQRAGRYTNLPGGTYSLRVKGSNNDGGWNENTDALHLVVIPPLWERTWFQLVLASTLILAVLAGFRWRIVNIQQRSQELSRLVAERTKEVEKRRQVAEGLREVILMLNQNLSLQDSLGYIVCQVAQLLNAEWVFLFQCDADGQARTQPVCQYAKNPVELNIKDILPNRLLCSIFNQLREGTRPVHTTFSELSSGLNPTILRLFEGISHAVTLPVILETDIFGGITALLDKNSHLSQDEAELFATFCEQAALAIGNDRLRTQAQQLAVVSERNRLARDLHDAVTQTLFSASLIAETIPALWEEDPREGRELLLELRLLTRGALAEMRTLLMELRPTVMVDVKLSDLLRQLVEGVTGKKGILVKFNANDIDNLPEEVHICLYRIAQEALANIVKHSRARNISVSLVEKFLEGEDPSHEVTLEINDDGRGFDPTFIPPDHFGLANMRERAQAAGAMLEIHSRPGAGTTVRAIWIGKDMPR